MNDNKYALVVGNSDGIGLAFTRRLLDLGWRVHGISRSASSIAHDRYEHDIADVTAEEFQSYLSKATGEKVDLCVYCVGIGEQIDFKALDFERRVFAANLMGAVRTIETVLPGMLERGGGHIIGLSSLADALVVAEAPSYSASKAGLSAYLEGLALAVRDRGVAITNIRFGFVDTKMAKGAGKHKLMPVDKAVDYMVNCLKKRPIRFSRPRLGGFLVEILRWVTRLRM